MTGSALLSFFFFWKPSRKHFSKKEQGYGSSGLTNKYADRIIKTNE